MGRFDELINGERLPILFVGSGFTKRYNVDMPSWEELLKNTFKLIGVSELQYFGIKNEILSENNCTEQELFQKLGTELERMFNVAFYQGNFMIPEMQDYSKWLHDEISPFKKYLSIYFSNLSLIPEMESELIELKKLSNKIMSIITTNYDLFLEETVFSGQCDVFIGQNNLFNPDAVNVLDVYKIHGCVKDAKSIIITENDYKKFNRNGKLISAKLLTLITENPIIFIGYSISDENILKILSDFVTCLSEEDLQKLFSHIYFIQFKENENELLEEQYIFKLDGESVHLPLTKITTNNYLKLYQKLNQLVPSVPLDYIKPLKRIFKHIITQNSTPNPESDTLLVDYEFLQDIQKANDFKKVAIAFGPKTSMIENFGYSGYGIKEIIEDILFEKYNFNAEKLLLNSIETKIAINSLFPVHKYLSQVDSSILEQTPKLKNYINYRSSVESFISTQLKRDLKYLPEIKYSTEIPDDYNITKRMKVILKNHKNMCLEDIRNYLANQFKENPMLIKNSEFKRAVAIYDYLKYKNTTNG
ncbi:hypothetical protein GMA92_10500 [Turicibacter sanguinis]|uniref:SIR2-like domain-containing protein n=2 Tax=Turicibacter sanguinis TaxID=154288 RepID=A0A9X4XEE0_9FIRM|nr:SIR2 family protein [Turicibacter sanguinis]EFF65092.1 conserved domain protein [Turicibacter sanguinis PC909]MTK21844.1 hypothetical protein [Turicibacter sanguinis]MTK72991.1 hypothetical protein [Turicibacter sanguinis]